MTQLYSVYEKNTLELARTATIKLDLVCDAINTELTYKGYHVDDFYPRQFKYYMNLAGQYHDYDHQLLMAKYATRHIMVTIATDNGFMKVPFVKELFHGPDANRSLLNEYQMNTSFYKRLVRQYPEFETLIIGILNPINIDAAIAAPDGSILSMAYHQRQVRATGEVYYEVPESVEGTRTTKLIEPQEHNLINELQKFIDKVLFRWVVKDYARLDDMYAPYVLGSLTAVLPGKIMNIRMANCHTPFVHTFHVYHYLESHGELGKYIDQIPQNQLLYLYRNVRYLELNLGKTFTFNEVIRNMFTPSGVPIAGYFLRHDLSDMDNTNLVPESYLQREHLNFKSLGAGDDTREIREILEEQIPLARENYKYIDQVERVTQQQASRTEDDELLTKVLESELIQIASPLPVEFSSMLVWYWVYLSSRGFYTGSVFVTNPVTEERIAITPLNGFILFLYCINLGVTRVPLKTIPNGLELARFIIKSNYEEDVPRHPAFAIHPLETMMAQHIDTKSLSINRISDIVGKYEGSYRAHDPKSFHALVEDHYLEMQRRYFEICKIEDVVARGYGEYVFKQSFWHNIPIKLVATDGELYESWLSKLAINFKYFNPTDYIALASSLLEACTGMTSKTQLNKRLLQSAMIDILKHFSSYTTHILSSVSESSVTNLQGKYLRLGDINVDGDGSGGHPLDLSLDLTGNSGYGEADMPIFSLDNWNHLSLPHLNLNLGQYSAINDKPTFTLKANTRIDDSSITLVPKQ